MPRIIDLTLPIGPGVATWPGDPELRVKPHLTLDRDRARVHELHLGTHTGTHIDAPAHLLPNGADVSSIPLETLHGPATVLYLPDADTITADVLAKAAPAPTCPRVLLKTRNTTRNLLHAATLTEDYVALDASGARWLVERGVVVVGIDAMSVDPFESEALPAHHILLQSGAVIVEGLDLRKPKAGEYELVCAPLRLDGLDGAPARVWLVAQ